MKIGKYTIGKFPAIIKKTYLPRSLNRIEYETNFEDINDIFESMYVLKDCIGDVYTIDGQMYELIHVEMIYGTQNIKKELITHNQ